MSGPAVDTIAAVSTAPGPGAVAMIRLSGPRAGAILRTLAPGVGGTPEPRRAVLARIVEPGSERLLDRALVTFFRAPRSYTGEDVVELSCHGGWLVPGLILEACVASGARRAEPGEFTRRAYLNGKMDLVQAEAVLDLVGGRSRALHEAAVHQIERGLSRRLDELREAILEIEALLVHHIDFPEEDDPPASTGQIAARARLLVEGLARLLETAPEGELLRDGALTVLAGVPNAGKSSLFNALLGRERAIVTEVAGTTRDAVESVVSLGGFPFRLVDTAGLRRGGERVESLGIEVARRYLARADLILFCAEWGRELTPEEEAFLDEERDAPVVLVRTKADEQGAGGASASGEGAPEGEDGVPGGPVAVSTVTGRGLAGLRALLPRLVFRGLVSAEGEAPLLTRARQARGVDRAREEIEAFAGALESGVPPELAATHLGSAETALEEVLGVVVRDEVLDRVFREFCVGK